MKRIISLACMVVAALTGMSLVCCGAAAQNKEQRFSWPHWGGPEGNWISRETNWYPEALNGEKPVAWIADIGYRYSNIAVQQNRLYALGSGGVNQWVICLDALTGRQLWKHTYKLRGLNPQSTPSIDGDTVFTLSEDGLVLCLDARRGKVIWSRNLGEDFNVLRPRYGFSASPVVEGDRLLITAIPTVSLSINRPVTPCG